MLQTIHALDEQTGCGQQDNRHRDFDGDEQVTRTRPARRRVAHRQPGGRIGPREVQRRQHADGQRGQHGDGRREREHGAIDADRCEERCPARNQRDQDLHQPHRLNQAGCAAGDCQHGALDQELTEQAAASGAERRANRDFRRAVQRLREQELTGVDAGNQQHQRDGGHEVHQRGSTPLRHRVMERLDVQAKTDRLAGAAIQLRMLGFDTLRRPSAVLPTPARA